MTLATEASRCRIGVLISGSGTNLQAFIDQVRDGKLPAEIVLVVANRRDAYGLKRAQAAGIPCVCIPHGDFDSREAFDQAVANELDAVGVDLVILAGFMRILSASFVRHFEGRILNIHPALLPLYPGLNTHARTLEAGDTHHGSTVHFVTEELDGGPRVLAGRIPIDKSDTPASLQARVQDVEHRIYPQTATLFATGRLTYRDGVAWLDGQKLIDPIVRDFE